MGRMGAVYTQHVELSIVPHNLPSGDEPCTHHPEIHPHGSDCHFNLRKNRGCGSCLVQKRMMNAAMWVVDSAAQSLRKKLLHWKVPMKCTNTVLKNIVQHTNRLRSFGSVNDVPLPMGGRSFSSGRPTTPLTLVNMLLL